MKTGETKRIKPKSPRGQAAPRCAWMTPYFISRYDNSTLYYGADRLYKSKNRGDDWTAISPDLTQVPEERNARYRAIPLSLKVVSRTDAEWLALKKALKHEKVCLKDGEEVHADVVTALATWRGATPVATAKATLDANLPSVTAAWKAALG